MKNIFKLSLFYYNKLTRTEKHSAQYSAGAVLDLKRFKDKISFLFAVLKQGFKLVIAVEAALIRLEYQEEKTLVYVNDQLIETLAETMLKSQLSLYLSTIKPLAFAEILEKTGWERDQVLQLDYFLFNKLAAEYNDAAPDDYNLKLADFLFIDEQQFAAIINSLPAHHDIALSLPHYFEYIPKLLIFFQQVVERFADKITELTINNFSESIASIIAAATLPLKKLTIYNVKATNEPFEKAFTLLFNQYVSSLEHVEINPYMAPRVLIQCILAADKKVINLKTLNLGDRIPIEELIILLQCCPQLKQLYLNKFKNLSATCLEEAMPHNQIEKLDLAFSDITPVELRILLLLCPQVKILDLGFCQNLSEEWDLTETISYNLKQVEELDLLESNPKFCS